MSPRPSAEPVIRTRAIVNLPQVGCQPQSYRRPGLCPTVGEADGRVGFAISKQGTRLDIP